MNRRTPFIASVFLFCGIVYGAQQATPARQATPAPQAGANQTAQPAKAKISGVVNGAGQALRKASVTLMPAGNQGNQGNRGQAGLGGQFNQAAQPGQATAQQGAAQQAQPGQAARGQQAQTTPNQTQNAQNQRGGGGGGGGARTMITGDDGTFTFQDVNPGTYRIRVD